MAMFVIRCSQWVEEIAYVKVEADSPEAAIVKVEEYNDLSGIDNWREGDSIDGFKAEHVAVEGDGTYDYANAELIEADED